MADKPSNDSPENRPPVNENIRAAYARARQTITEEDLQRYAQPEDEGIPLDQLIDELEEIHRNGTPGKKERG